MTPDALASTRKTMSWAEIHSRAKAAAVASLAQEIRKSPGIEVTSKPSVWSDVHKSGRVRLFVGAPQGVFWKNSAFFVVDAALDAAVHSNRHVLVYRSYVKKEGMLVLDVPPEAAPALHASVRVRVFRVDAGPLELLKARCEVLEELDRGPVAEHLWSTMPVQLRGWSPRYLPLDRALNDGQQLALAAMTSPGGFFVWGPPGTGKTTVITSAVKAAIDRGQSVLITSHTNVAVDNVLESLVKDNETYDLGAVTPGRIVRQVGQDLTKLLDAVREHAFLRVDRAAAVITNLEAGLSKLDAQLSDNQSHADRKSELVLRDEMARRDVDPDKIRRLKAAESPWNELLTTERRLRDVTIRVAELTALQHERSVELDALTRRAREHEEAKLKATTAREALAQWQALETERLSQLEVTLRAAQVARSALDIADLRVSMGVTRVFPWVAQRRKLEQAQASLAHSQCLQAQSDAARSTDEAATAIRGWGAEYKRRLQELEQHSGVGGDLDLVKAQIQGVRVRRHHAETDRQALEEQAARLGEIVGDTAQLEDQIQQAHASGAWELTAEYDELLPRILALDAELSRIEHRRARLKDQYEQTKIKLLADAPVVAATLTALTTNEQLRKRRFDVVIIDESASAEASLLLIAAAKADKTLTIVGDFLQNAPIADADDSHDEPSKEVKRWQTLDIFALAGIADRASAEDHPRCVAISIQYRYPPIIAKTVNSFCYDGLLQSHKSESASPSPVIVFIDTSEFADGSLRRHGNSWECPRTRDIAFEIAAKITEGTIGCVTPYRPQANAMKRAFTAAGLDVPTGTSHEFQGREFDTVIFDLMQDDQLRWVGTADLRGAERATGAAKLLNVALTRAKERLYVIGNWRFVRDHDSPGMRALADLDGDPQFELRPGASVTSNR